MTRPRDDEQVDDSTDDEPPGVENTISGEVRGRAVQARSIIGDIHIWPTPKYVPPQQIPPPPRRWPARATEIAELTSRIASAERPIVVLTGPPAVGKTTLALRWAQNHRGRWPDGQLWADLGDDPTAGPADPETVLAGWLLALGMSAGHLPPGAPARSAELRTRTADARIMIVLDDAMSTSQIRPLLPSGADTLTIVCTRNPLTGLLFDGASFLPIGPHLADIDDQADDDRLASR
jgi:hypothetical protein